MSGKCYLKAVLWQEWSSAVDRLQEWPTVECLLESPRSWFLPGIELEGLAVVKTELGVHVGESVEGDGSVSLAAALAGVATVYESEWPEGSLGEYIAECAPQCVRVSWLALGTKVGGYALDAVRGTLSACDLSGDAAASVCRVLELAMAVDAGLRFSGEVAVEVAAVGGLGAPRSGLVVVPALEKVQACESDLCVSGTAVVDDGVSEKTLENRARRRRKAERKRKRQAMGGDWRTSAAVPSLAGSRCETLSSGSELLVAESKARRTLADRRVVENELAVVKGRRLLESYADEGKSRAYAELQVLRLAQRSNEARARSEKSWKQCDESLGSLGSAGSAGEFFVKQEYKKEKIKRENAEALVGLRERELAVAMKYLPSEAKAEMSALPVPVTVASESDCGCGEFGVCDMHERFHVGVVH